MTNSRQIIQPTCKCCSLPVKTIRHSFHIPVTRFARTNGLQRSTCVDPCSPHVRRLVNTACLLCFDYSMFQTSSSAIYNSRFVTRLLQHFRH